VAIEPLQSPRISHFLSDRRRIAGLCDTFGSPLNVVFPEQVAENLAAFQKALSERMIDGRVLCTSKPNRSRAVLSMLARRGMSVDVSSRRGLAEALSSGIPGSRIQITGPKTVDYLAIAAAHGSTITVDNPSELEMLSAVVRGGQPLTPTSILLRIRGRRSGFRAGQDTTPTFGSSDAEITELLTKLTSLRSQVSLRGFHFHLHGATNAERSDTFSSAFGALRKANQIGFSADTINIGGGFKIRYAASEQQFARFTDYLKQAVRKEVKPITWQNDGLGYRLDSRGVGGAPKFTDHAPAVHGVDEFAELLSMRCAELDNQPIERIVSDSMLRLWVEPGRASFDQGGLTIGRVTHTTISESERPLIRVEMNQSNLRSSQQTLLTQPIFLPSEPRKSSPLGMFLVGNLCIAQDLLQPNAVYPGFIPEAGDLVIFVNTAAYLMDFIESEMLLQPTARKVAAVGCEDSWKLCLDEEFSAFRLEGER
jgi:diaminopimelate decarboxylase